MSLWLEFMIECIGLGHKEKGASLMRRSPRGKKSERETDFFFLKMEKNEEFDFRHRLNFRRAE